jgi:hypothetical protein
LSNGKRNPSKAKKDLDARIARLKFFTEIEWRDDFQNVFWVASNFGEHNCALNSAR